MTESNTLKYLKSFTDLKIRNAVRITSHLHLLTDDEVGEITAETSHLGGITENGKERHPFQELLKFAKEGVDELSYEIKRGERAKIELANLEKNFELLKKKVQEEVDNDLLSIRSNTTACYDSIK